MIDYEALPISDKLAIEVVPKRPFQNLPAEVLKRIDFIWEQEHRIRGGHLYNGLILNVAEFDQNRIIGFFVEYKHLLALLRDPSLKSYLNITPVCVSAVTHARPYVLIARRSGIVTQFPHMYECVPSGGIDPSSLKNGTIDIMTQLKKELQEEAGIGNGEKIRLFAIVYEPSENLFEICAEITLDESKAKTSLKTSEEYDKIEWVHQSNLAAFSTHPERSFVPLSLWLLRYLTFI